MLRAVLQLPLPSLLARGGPETPGCHPHHAKPLQVLLEVWGESDTLEGLREVLAAYPAEEKAKWGGPDQVRAAHDVNSSCSPVLAALTGWLPGHVLFCAKHAF